MLGLAEAGKCMVQARLQCSWLVSLGGIGEEAGYEALLGARVREAACPWPGQFVQ